ncbi:hypothetical protein JCM11641_008321 [Rhodosporidiobolus odoratus]
MFIPTPLSFVSWICTVKGWVVLQSFILGAGYFAAAYVLREIVFPVLKSLFENFIVYQFFKGPLGDWIIDVKTMFYAALIYTAIGFAGLVGAILEVGFLLIPYLIYLAIGAVITAKKVWEVLQSILSAEKDLKKACDAMSGLFGGNCDQTFEDIKKYTYGAAFVFGLLQISTFFCVVFLIRRIHKKTGIYFFTICGHRCGGDRKDDDTDSDNDLEKAVPHGRRRRTAIPLLTVDEQRQAKVAAIPQAAFSLPRRNRQRAVPPSDAIPQASFEMGRSSRRNGDRRHRYPPQPRATVAYASTASEAESGRSQMRSLGKKRNRRKRRSSMRAGEEEEGSDAEEGLLTDGRDAERGKDEGGNAGKGTSSRSRGRSSSGTDT